MEILIEILWRNRKRLKKLGKAHPEVLALVWLCAGVVALWRALMGVQRPSTREPAKQSSSKPTKIVPLERKDGEMMTEWIPVYPLKNVMPMENPRPYRAEKMAH